MTVHMQHMTEVERDSGSGLRIQSANHYTNGRLNPSLVHLASPHRPAISLLFYVSCAQAVYCLHFLFFYTRGHS